MCRGGNGGGYLSGRGAGHRRAAGRAEAGGSWQFSSTLGAEHSVQRQSRPERGTSVKDASYVKLPSGQ